MESIEPIIWTGDLEDDCIAIGNGLILRAESMDKKIWWWAVSINKDPWREIDSSNNYDTICIGGENARRFAEQAAQKFLNMNEKK